MNAAIRIILACSLLLGVVAGAQAQLCVEGIGTDLARGVFSDADARSRPLKLDVAVRAVFGSGRLLGWVFLTDEVSPIPAYSGKPVSVLVGLRPDGRIAGARMVAHEEPILVIGVSDKDLQHFIAQYDGIDLAEKVRVAAQERPGCRGVDGITGATITVMVINRW